MPWNMNDFPPAMKNLEDLTRKKAIEIGNALLSEGYPDDRAIPIAISQAKEWYDDADEEEKKHSLMKKIHKKMTPMSNTRIQKNY